MVEKSFAYRGSCENFTLPATGYYRLEVWGAQGGDVEMCTGWGYYPGCGKGRGGYGGYAKGVFHFNAGETLTICVGQQGIGNVGAIGSGRLNNRAFNGGSKAGGGGATDIRYRGSGLGNRIIVAGAGGGGASPELCGYLSSRGGHGGNASGEGGTVTAGCTGGCVGWCYDWKIGSGGTQSSGYSLGQGEDGVTNDSNGQPGGGGGGGYYGGRKGAGGGGCSSFISGYSAGGCSTAQGKASISSSWTRGARSGNGQAKIKFCGSGAC